MQSCSPFVLYGRMRRISTDEIRMQVYVVLRTFSRNVKRGLVSKLPHEADAATGQIADAITERIAGGSYRLIAPDKLRTKDSGEQLGEWGPDDPDPTE